MNQLIHYFLRSAAPLAQAWLTWVERTEIDKVVKEQTLQQLLAPKAAKERAAMGRLLKADLLILMRSTTREMIPRVEITICEVSSALPWRCNGIPIMPR